MATTRQAKFKDFGKTIPIEDYPTITFALNGEEFTCRPALPGRMLLEFVRRADAETGGTAAMAIIDFLVQAVDESETERFEALLNDPDQIVQVETLGEIVGWLVEQYSARPTKGRSRSSAGRSNGGRTSTDTSSEEEST